MVLGLVSLNSKGISGILRLTWTMKQWVSEILISCHFSETVKVGEAVKKVCVKYLVSATSSEDSKKWLTLYMAHTL